MRDVRPYQLAKALRDAEVIPRSFERLIRFLSSIAAAETEAERMVSLVSDKTNRGQTRPWAGEIAVQA
jgi:hypothetical protein